ncbi:MAG: PDZ domain-containing protein [Novosphingobium sp.]|nr:PDZ domain-containing protein [Novosphingobium sp.]
MAGAPQDARQATDSEAENSLLFLQSLDQKVADISWRLAASSADICPDKYGALGINLHDAAQYIPRIRPAAIAAFGFGDGFPAVLSIAAGSPAQLAGVEIGDRITAIDGIALTPHTVRANARAYYDIVEALMSRLEALPAGTAIQLDLLRGEESLSLTLSAHSLCQVRVEVVPGGKINADSGERIVQVHGKLAVWVRSDDELALVIAHEMAHIFRGHHGRLKQERIGTGLFSGFGKNGRKLRDIERESDRYGIFIAARAGYDYRVAGALWRRLSKASGLSGIWATSHPNARNRGRHADAVVKEVEALHNAGLALNP